MDINQMVEIVSTIGFPIFITLYILVRLESKMENLNNSINELTTAIKEKDI